jgi:hypothetical protein
VTRIRIGGVYDLMLSAPPVRECVLAEFFCWCGACSRLARMTGRRFLMSEMEKRIARFIEPFRVDPGSSVKLAKDFDPAFKAGVKKKDGVELLKSGIELLSEYQARLAARTRTASLWCSRHSTPQARTGRSAT